jgi:hypothetical protein
LLPHAVTESLLKAGSIFAPAKLVWVDAMREGVAYFDRALRRAHRDVLRLCFLHSLCDGRIGTPTWLSLFRPWLEDIRKHLWRENHIQML